LSTPTVATEGNGTLSGQGVVTVVPTPLTSDVTVNLTSGNTSKVTVPASVLIPAGQSNTPFDLTIVPNPILHGDKPAPLTPTAPACTNGPQTKTITVHDNETTTLTVTLPASASETAGTLVGAGTVSMGGTAGASVTVSLSRSNTTRLILPATVTIPSGQTSVV